MQPGRRNGILLNHILNIVTAFPKAAAGVGGACVKQIDHFFDRDTGREKGAFLRRHIEKIFPELTGTMRSECRKATVAQLLSHTSGLPYSPSKDESHERFKGLNDSVKNRYEYVKNALVDPPVGKPGEKFVYSGGPNDVINLSTLGIPAVGLCSNTVTETQTRRLEELARRNGIGIISLMLHTDEPGEIGLKQSFPMLARQGSVRLIWSREMYGGRFREMQSEILKTDELRFMLEHLQ